jgi:hypothetical protein
MSCQCCPSSLPPPPPPPSFRPASQPRENRREGRLNRALGADSQRHDGCIKESSSCGLKVLDYHHLAGSGFSTEGSYPLGLPLVAARLYSTTSGSKQLTRWSKGGGEKIRARQVGRLACQEQTADQLATVAWGWVLWWHGRGART